MPMAMFTFLERYDLTGKRVIPFCTNEGSGMGGSERDLKKNLQRSGCGERPFHSRSRSGKFPRQGRVLGQKDGVKE